MNVLAIDPGVNTGFALRLNEVVESGTQVFDLRRGESAGIRFIRFNLWLDEIGANLQPGDLIVYEQAHLRGGATTDLLVGMTTRIEEFCAKRELDHKAVHTSTLKKAVTGSGHADKETIALAVAEHFDSLRIPQTEHEADALGLLIFFDKGMPEAQSRKKKKRADNPK